MSGILGVIFLAGPDSSRLDAGEKIGSATEKGAALILYLRRVKFFITPLLNGKAVRLPVEKTETTATTETYKIEVGDHAVTLQTNRLLFRQKGLKHRKGWWKVLAGQFKYETAKEAICQAIEKADPEKIL